MGGGHGKAVLVSVILGVDPGLTGAIAALDEGGGFVRVFDMPVASGVVATRLLCLQLAQLDVGAAYVEKVASMPGQGVSSMFRFGRALGAVEGVLGALAIPVRWASPGVWKRAHGLIGKDKDASRLLALERWPEAADRLKRKKDHGRAEALLMADFGRKST